MGETTGTKNVIVDLLQRHPTGLMVTADTARGRSALHSRGHVSCRPLCTFLETQVAMKRRSLLDPLVDLNTWSVGYTNRYRSTTKRYPGVHSFQSRKTIVKVGLMTPEGVRRPSSAWLTGIIVTLLHGCEVTFVACDAFSANMLLRAEACELVLWRASLFPPALCEPLFGRLLRRGTERLSVFAFNAVVNAEW